MNERDRCRCGEYLYGEIERDTGLCCRCADREYERHMERREFEYFHPPLPQPPLPSDEERSDTGSQQGQSQPDTEDLSSGDAA